MKNKRAIIILIATTMLLSVLMLPFKAYAFNESGLKLNIDTSTIEITEAWSQIKNAAIVHLITQKMAKCINDGHIMSDTSAARPKNNSIGEKGVLESGDVFKHYGIDDYVKDILDEGHGMAVGPWLSSIFGQKSGSMNCGKIVNGFSLFDIFMYIYEKYMSGSILNNSDIENPKASEATRLKGVCDRNDPTQPGLLQNNGNGDCNSAYLYRGRTKEEQLSYLSKLYNDMRNKSGNPYIMAWDGSYSDSTPLGTYDAVDGYYLYSNDFEVQCLNTGIATWTTNANADSSESIRGFQIDNSTGKTTSGYYKINAASDTARESFAGSGKTCSQLVNRMNELIGPYIKIVNARTFRRCSTEIHNEINAKWDEISEKYINNPDATAEEKTDAQVVLDEYSRIMRENEYVIDYEGNLKQITGSITTDSQLEEKMPETYVYTCRSHLPYIDVVVVKEEDLATAIENEFKDDCLEVVDMGWVVCPVLNALSNAVDSISNWIDGEF